MFFFWIMEVWSEVKEQTDPWAQAQTGPGWRPMVAGRWRSTWSAAEHNWPSISPAEREWCWKEQPQPEMRTAEAIHLYGDWRDGPSVKVSNQSLLGHEKKKARKRWHRLFEKGTEAMKSSVYRWVVHAGGYSHFNSQVLVGGGFRQDVWN